MENAKYSVYILTDIQRTQFTIGISTRILDLKNFIEESSKLNPRYGTPVANRLVFVQFFQEYTPANTWLMQLNHFTKSQKEKLIISYNNNWQNLWEKQGFKQEAIQEIILEEVLCKVKQVNQKKDQREEKQEGQREDQREGQQEVQREHQREGQVENKPFDRQFDRQFDIQFIRQEARQVDFQLNWQIEGQVVGQVVEQMQPKVLKQVDRPLKSIDYTIAGENLKEKDSIRYFQTRLFEDLYPVNQKGKTVSLNSKLPVTNSVTSAKDPLKRFNGIGTCTPVFKKGSNKLSNRTLSKVSTNIGVKNSTNIGVKNSTSLITKQSSRQTSKAKYPSAMKISKRNSRVNV